MTRNRIAGMVVVACLLVSAATLADESMPWAFNAPRAEGYSIDLISAEPAPGTALRVGASVTFLVKVEYTLNVAPQGEVVLVFQDDSGRTATPGESQQVTKVHSSSGRLTLTQTVVVPDKTKELRLFIPIVPDGMEKTTGEVTLRYPIEK